MSEPEIQPPEWVIEIRDGNGMFWGLPWPIRFNWFMRLLLLCSGWKHREEKQWRITRTFGKKPCVVSTDGDPTFVYSLCDSDIEEV